MTDAEIRRWAREFRSGMLGRRSSRDQCFVVSAPLCNLLQFAGLKCELVNGNIGENHHYWIEFADGRIIDATADQFGRRRIYLEKPPKDYVKSYEADCLGLPE
jgi:hypothetical protein